MKKEYKIGLIAIGIIVLIIILNFIGILWILNHPLNTLIAGTPDRSCDIDSDCVLSKIDCHACSCKEAVNKDWKSFCPFKESPFVHVYCKPCASLGHDFEIKCVEDQCQIVWEKEGIK